MPVSIVSNLSTQYAQQAIQERNAGMTASTQRLSSGLRVFRADQDAAAMAVGTSLKVENAALKQAQLNVVSGVSMLQIADGALGQMGDVLTRMQALATQASSGNVADLERGIIDREFQALKAEVDRIANDTEFNGVFMLAGETQFALQGAHTYAADGIVNMVFDPKLVETDASFRYSYDALTEALTLTRIDPLGSSASQTIDLTNLLNSMAGTGMQLGAGQQLELNFSGVGVVMTLGPTFDRTADILPTVTDNAGDVTFADVEFVPTIGTVPFGTAAAMQGLGAAYNHMTGMLTLDVTTDGAAAVLEPVAGIRYSVNGGAMSAAGAASANLIGATTVDLFVDDGAGGFTLLGRMGASAISTAGGTGGTLGVPVGQGIIDADMGDTQSGVVLTYKVGSGVVAGQDLINITIPAVTQGALGLLTTNVLNKMNADAALSTVKEALTTLSQARATVGAQQSRLEMLGRNLDVTVENNEGARSALMDVDVASEITALANDQAMLEVGVSMLSKANRLPDMLLQMLRNS